MKLFRLILWFSIFCSQTSFSQKIIILDQSYDHLTIDSFSKKLKSQFNISIFYDKKNLSDTIIHGSNENQTLEDLLNENFKNKNLQIFFDTDNNVFLSNRTINIFDETDFFSVINGQHNGSNNIVVNNNDQTKEYFIENIIIGQKGVTEPEICLVSVKLINNEDGLPVVGAIVTEKNTANSKISDNMGAFSMKLSKGIHSFYHQASLNWV
jgi:hypothetical protein